MKPLDPVFQRIKTPVWVILILTWLICTYFFVYFVLYDAFPADIGFYFIQPLLWGSLAGISWIGYRYLEKKPIFNSNLMVWSVLAGLLQTALFFIAAIFLKFGKSPYSTDFLHLFGNLFQIITLTIGIEMSRTFLGVALKSRFQGIALGVVAIIYTFITIPIGQYSLFSSIPTALEVLGKSILPIFAKNLLATFLAISGGPLVAIGYMGILILLEWIPPILPDLPWMVTVFLGTLYPLAIWFILDEWLNPNMSEPTPKVKEDKKYPQRDKNSGKLFSWSLIAIIACGLLGLNTGMFGVRPFLVTGGSMIPALSSGDIVFTRTIDPNELVTGDIVRFSRGSIEVIHRIMVVDQGNNGQIFTTRGDSNTADDIPLHPSDIRGKMVLVIPKIGWPFLVLRSLLAQSKMP